MQNQGSNNKDIYHSKKLQPKDLKPYLLCDNKAKLAKKKIRKIKKRDFGGKDRNILRSRINYFRLSKSILPRPQRKNLGSNASTITKKAAI